MAGTRFGEVVPDATFAAAVSRLGIQVEEACKSRQKWIEARKNYDSVLVAFAKVNCDSLALQRLGEAGPGASLEAVRRAVHRSLARLGSCLDDRQRVAVGIEAIAMFGWDVKGIKRDDDPSTYAAVLSKFDERFDEEACRTVAKGFQRHSKWLMGKSVSKLTKMSLAVGAAALTAVTAGVGAPAVGAFIGSTLFGLSGAAATSAGLAFLGGGSIASGGLGMAGGVLMLKMATGAAYKGGARVATVLAASSRSAFVGQLAQLHLLAALGGFTSEEVRELMDQLAEMDSELMGEIEELRMRLRTLESRASRTIREEWKKAHRARAKEVSKQLSTLAGSRRALQAEQASLSRRFTLPRWVDIVPWESTARWLKLWVS